MGGSSSKSSTEIVNDVIQEVIMKSTQSCQTTVSMNQLLEVDTPGAIHLGDITQSNKSVINASCMLGAEKVAELQGKIKSAIDQMTESSSSLISLSQSDSESYANITNNIKQAVTFDTIQEALNTVYSSQTIRLKSGMEVIVGDIKQENDINAITNVIMNDSQVASAVTELDNAVKQDTKADTSFLNLGSIFDGLGLGGLFSGLGVAGPIISGGIVLCSLCMCCIMVLALVWMLFGGDSQPQQMQPQFVGQF